MELWIRSQDRESIFKVKSIFYSTNNENKHFVRSIIVDDIKNGIMALGQYSSKERALEVLDEIQNIIYINKLFNADINAFQESLKIEGYTEKEIAQALKTISTYEMPKE